MALSRPLHQGQALCPDCFQAGPWCCFQPLLWPGEAFSTWALSMESMASEAPGPTYHCAQVSIALPSGITASKMCSCSQWLVGTTLL